MRVAEIDAGLGVSVAVFDGGAITVERLRLPERLPGQLDVAITAAAICGSELHTVLGHRTTPPRTVLGHEGVGVIVGVDNGATDLRGVRLGPGDRVVFAMYSACGSCDRCAAGLAMKCRSLLKYGHESATTPPYATGTLATCLRIAPGAAVLRIPDDIADEQVVSAGCGVATAAAVVAAAGPPGPGTRALVLGAGAVGAYSAAMLAGLGCAVWVRDPAPGRLRLAAELGARTDDDGGDPFPVVVEASGNTGAFVEAVHVADVGGRIVAAGSVSPGSSTVSFDPALVVTRRLTIVGVHNYTAEDFRWGVDWLLTRGRDLAVERLVSPPVPLSAIQEGFRQMRAGRYPRILVRPSTTED